MRVSSLKASGNFGKFFFTFLFHLHTRFSGFSLGFRGLTTFLCASWYFFSGWLRAGCPAVSSKSAFHRWRWSWLASYSFLLVFRACWLVWCFAVGARARFLREFPFVLFRLQLLTPAWLLEMTTERPSSSPFLWARWGSVEQCGPSAPSFRGQWETGRDNLKL